MTIIAVASVESGLGRLRAEPSRFAFVSLYRTAAPDVFDGRIALMTAFGPVVREIEGQTTDLVRQMLRDMVSTGHPPIVLLHAETADILRTVSETASVVLDIDPSRAPQAYEAFLGDKAAIAGGRDGKLKWWSVAPVGARAFDVGDVIQARVEGSGSTTAVRYVRDDGQDAGLHGVFGAALTDGVKARVAAFVGRIDAVVYGVMPAEDGDEIVVQTLTFEIPADLARSLQDGKLPRHAGIAGAKG